MYIKLITYFNIYSSTRAHLNQSGTMDLWIISDGKLKLHETGTVR